MRSIALTLFIFASSSVMAQTVNVQQKNQGSVEAKLEATNVSNVALTNSAVGNLAIINNTNHDVDIIQDNIGDISSTLIRSNISNTSVEQNVAGTLTVVN